MDTKSTITGGLGIPDSFAEKADEIVHESLKQNETISDALIQIAKEVREDSLGECDASVSDYEKRLIFSGFVLGIKRVDIGLNQAKNAAFSDFLGEFLKAFGKSSETEDDE